MSGPRAERPQDYEVLELLGEGGFARVFRARCCLTGCHVAMKKIDKALMSLKRMEGRVRQEVMIHSRLKHPSVLELHTFFEDADYVYLILELAHNGELARYFKSEQKGLKEAMVADILRQLVDGVLYLHSHRIIHRDLSLNNLLLTSDLKVKIADFGLATQLSEPDEKHMTMCGTPNYISPEVASRSNHGLPADIWGLGCLLYTLLVGKPPFDTQHVKHTLNRVMQADYRIPSGLSYEAQDLLEKMLRKNPSDRISLNQILQHPFLNKRSFSRISCQSSMEMSKDSGFHATLNTTQSTQHRHRSQGRFASTHSDVLFYQRKNSIDIDDLNKLQVKTFPAVDNVYSSRGNSNNSRNSSDTGKQLTESDYSAQPIGNSTSPSENILVQNIDSAELESKNDCVVLNNFNMDNKENLLSGSRTIGVPPLCTIRLPEVTHRTRNAELLISEDGLVTIKFIKKSGRSREEKATGVFTVSKDGMQVSDYPVDGGKGLPISSLSSYTPSFREDFSYHTLPQKHWKKYLYASHFVSLVKAKIPKITLYTRNLKCQLMENGTDFEGTFHTGGKIILTASDGIKITDKRGNIYHNPSDMDNDIQKMSDDFHEAMKRCLEVEPVLPENCFPITMGRRPQINKPNDNCHYNNKQSTPITPALGTINISSFCHSTGSNISRNTRTFNPCGEVFKTNNQVLRNKASNILTQDYLSNAKDHKYFYM